MNGPQTARTPSWQRPDLVSTFLRERRTVLPLLEVQEDVVRRLLERNPHPFTRFLDVGGGDGALSELVLSLEPAAEAVLVDFSEPMLEATFLPFATAAAARRSSMRELVHEPMNTLSSLMSCIGVRGFRPM